MKRNGNFEINFETASEVKLTKPIEKVVKNVILIPFKLKNPKTRLSGILSLKERKNLAVLMFSDVLESISRVSNVEKVIVAVPDEETAKICQGVLEEVRMGGIVRFESENSEITVYGAETNKNKMEKTVLVDVLVDERSLDDLVNHHIKELVDDRTSLAVIMADLPLLNPSLLDSFFNSRGDIVLSPGRKGGTNMILIRSPAFRVSYHYGSFMKHIEIARSRNLSVEIFDSFYSSIDIDDESDLLELLIHGEGKKSYSYLKSLGYSVNCSDKDPRIGVLEDNRRQFKNL